MKKILIVDDEPTFTSLLKSLLEKSGDFEVRVENRGGNAVEAAREFRPDLIFLDVIMPDLEGGEIAAQIEADKGLRNTPIVFLTAVVSKEEVLDQTASFGGYPFMAKPVTIEEVIRTIESHVR